MFGRVKMFNLGFIIFTSFSLLLTITWMHGTAGAIWLIVMRILQGVGAAFLVANSAAILTDAFPEHQRGMALGINQISGIAGVFLGLVLGGALAPVGWRLIFFVSVPVGLAGTLWSVFNLRELPFVTDRKIDWPGNVTFAAGLIALMSGVTYGIQPHGDHVMGWTSPLVISMMVLGVGLLVCFAIVERRSEDPMFHLALFKIRAFTAGSLSTFGASIARGGLMLMMVIWLQGIWLPLHGYSFSSTPLWAGIALLPSTLGFLVAGPISGVLSDRFGSRPFAVAGMLVSATTMALFALMPVDFSYPVFALLLFVNAMAMAMFASPKRAGIMNALPHQHRGVGGGMNSTFQNSGQVFAIGIFFTLMIVGLSSGLHRELASGLISQGVPVSSATAASNLPPVSTMFAALLGYNPLQHLLGPHVLAQLSPAARARVLSRGFFPSIIAGSFKKGIEWACAFSAVCCLLAAFASSLRGGKFIYQEAFEDDGPHDEAPFPRDPAFDAQVFAGAD
jgi:MFS family permease